MQQLPLSFTHKLASRGYVIPSSTIYRYMFSADVSKLLSSTIPSGSAGRGYFSSSTKGYMAGGPGNTTTASSFNFSSEVGKTISSLPAGTQGQGGSASTTNGYMQNGPSSGAGTAIHKLSFSAETWSSAGNAAYGPVYTCAGAWSTTAGYCIGGYISGNSYSAGVSKILFSNDSVSATSTLGTGTGNTSACQSSTKAYVLEGAKNGDLFTSVIQTVLFSNDSTATLGASFTNHFLGAAPMNSSTKGYAVGGAMNSGSNTGNQTILFSNDTTGSAGTFVAGIGDGNPVTGLSINV